MPANSWPSWQQKRPPYSLTGTRPTTHLRQMVRWRTTSGRARDYVRDCTLDRSIECSSTFYCFTRVPTVTWGQWMPLKSSITSCVYWSWSLSGWPPVPAIVSIQKVAWT